MKERINRIKKILDTYKENGNMKKANIFHLYQENEYGFEDGGMKGFHDSKIFSVWAFNTNTKEKTYLGSGHDGVEIQDEIIVKVRIFLDGSTLIKTPKPISWLNTQEIILKDF